MWIYHGTQIIPKAQFEGKEKVKNFNQHLNRTEMLSFEPRQYIVEGNILVVLAANIKE
jgi:hypothetical protein